MQIALKAVSVGASFLALLLFLTLANLGFRFTLKESVQARVRMRKEKRTSTFWIIRELSFSWPAGLLLAAFGYGSIARVIGGALANKSWPPELDSTPWYASTYSIAAILYIRQAFRLRDEYQKYRKDTDFRLWFRSVETDASCVADLYFYAGWIRRRMEQDSKDLQAVIIAILALNPILAVSKYTPGNFHVFSMFPSTVASIIAVILFRRLALMAWTALRPDLELASIVTVPLPMPSARNSKPKSGIVYIRPGSWRTLSHSTSFRAADCVELCVRATMNRLASDQREKVAMAARKIAESLRLRSLHAEDNPENLRTFREQLFYALRLVTSNDPVALIDPINKITLSDPYPPPPLQRRRALRIIEIIAGVINIHWPPLKAMLIITAIVVILIAGKQTDVLTLLK